MVRTLTLLLQTQQLSCRLRVKELRCEGQRTMKAPTRL